MAHRDPTWSLALAVDDAFNHVTQHVGDERLG